MTFQAYRVLRDIRRVQADEGKIVWMSEREKRFYTDTDDFREYVSIPFRYSLSQTLSILDDLKNNGFIKTENPDFSIIRTTHIGNHTAQQTVRMVLKFLAHSVVVPIAVSLLTSILFNLFKLN